MASKTKRNGKIELLRFVFCISIIIYHISTRFYEKKIVFDDFKLFHAGYIGVEFFFIVSGFLLAKSAMKPNDAKLPLGTQTVSFMRGKIMSLIVPHTIVFFVAFATGCIVLNTKLSEVPVDFVKALPCLFFLQKSGIPYYTVNAVEWYICSMLFSMLIIYPMCKKYKKTYTNVIAPVLGIMLIGYLVYKYSTLKYIKVYDVFTYKCNINAFAQINLGVCAYAISQKLKTLKLTRLDRIALTVIEAACYAFALFFSLGYFSIKYDVYSLMALFIAVPITFSDTSLFGEMFNNKFVYFLGRLSLYAYLIQVVAKDLIVIFTPNVIDNQILTVMAATAINIILGIGLMYLSKPIDKMLAGKLNKLN